MMKKRCANDFPDNTDKTHPNQSNTEHIVKEHRDALATTISVADIFKPEKDPIRTVLTIGEACTGKTYHANKFTRDWATSKSSASYWASFKSFISRKQQTADMLFHLTSRQLVHLKEKELSLVGLLNDLFRETKDCVILDYEKYNLVILLDGLDQLSLNFNDVKKVTDVREEAPVNILLTNLIKGNLLPSAHLWILSRPLQEAQQIPSEHVHRQTEIRGKLIDTHYCVISTLSTIHYASLFACTKCFVSYVFCF